MIDDHEPQFHAIRDAFAEKADLVYARHHREALALLRAQRSAFDAILLDLQWDNRNIADEFLLRRDGQSDLQARDMQGLAILQQLQQDLPDSLPPVIFVSTVRDLGQILECCRAGAREFLAKSDVRAHPEWVIGLIDRDQAARDFIDRLRQRNGVSIGIDGVNWLLSKRTAWNRRWSVITRAVLEYAARDNARHLGPRMIQDLDASELREIEANHREGVDRSQLFQMIQRLNLCGDWMLRRFESGVWLASRADGTVLAIVEPHLVNDKLVNNNWEQTAQSLHASCDIVRPAKLHLLKLGPEDPFWGGPHLLVVESAGTSPWDLSSQPEDARLAPWAARAGNVGFVGQDFWQRRQEQLHSLTTLPEFHRCALLPELLASSLPDREHACGRMQMLAVPQVLLRESLASQSPERLLLSLHSLVPVAESEIAQRLRALPSIEVRRTGYLNAFEEQTLQVVLDVLTRAGVNPAVVWVGCDFLYVRRRQENKRHKLSLVAQEYDLAILTKHGIMVLECKASTLDRDHVQGHVQVKKARELIWAGNDLRNAGIYLGPLLVEWLAVQPPAALIAPSILQMLPESLANKLDGQTHDAACGIVRQHYSSLERVRSQPQNEFYPEQFFSNDCNSIADIVGFVVTPVAARIAPAEQTRVLASQAFVLGVRDNLVPVLQGWLRRKPIFNDQQFDQVRVAMLHMSSAARTQGSRPFEGYEVERCGEVGSWLAHFGDNVLTEQSMTWLVRRYREEHGGSVARRSWGTWFATVLRNCVGELRLLDRRGLPALHERDLHQIALMLSGRVYTVETLDVSLRDRIGGMIALVKLVLDRPTQELIGLGEEEPTILLQQLRANTKFRWAWLPGQPLRRRCAGDGRAGLRRIFGPLRTMVEGIPDGVRTLLLQALAVTEHKVSHEDDTREALVRLLRAIRATRELA
jgi:CheY-like chemotaxis protein